MEETNFNENFEESETLKIEKEKKSGFKIKIAIGLSFASGALLALAYSNHKSKKRAKKLQIEIGKRIASEKVKYGNERVKELLADVLPLTNKRYIVERFDDFRGCTIGTLDDYLDDLSNAAGMIKKLDTVVQANVNKEA